MWTTAQDKKSHLPSGEGKLHFLHRGNWDAGEFLLIHTHPSLWNVHILRQWQGATAGLRSASQTSIQIPLTLKGIWVSKLVKCLWKSSIHKWMYSPHFPAQASHIFSILQTKSIPRNRLNDLHKASREARARYETDSKIFWVILDLNSGISVLPLSQSKELHWHSLIRRILYIPANILNIKKAVCSSDGL